MAATVWFILCMMCVSFVKSFPSHAAQSITNNRLRWSRFCARNDQLTQDRSAAQFSLRNAGEAIVGAPSNMIHYEGTNLCTNRPLSLNVLLNWKEPPKRILLLTKLDDTIDNPVAFAIAHLHSLGLEIVIESSLQSYLCNITSRSAGLEHLCANVPLITFDVSRTTVDFVITFGGDGLLLHCSALFDKRSIPPVMCFDFGSLGFLTPFAFDNFTSDVDAVLNEEIMLTLRMRLDCTIYRNSFRGDTYTVLNEAVVDRGPSPYLSVLDLTCDNEYITTLQGDGLIFATPTGSTAYSLAAGGSVMYPSVPAMLVTPVCAHSLSFRPMVLPDSAVLSCSVPVQCRSSGWVSFDGKFRQELQRGDKLEIRMSPHPMPTINRKSFTADWLDALREGFMYNQRPRQRPTL